LSPRRDRGAVSTWTLTLPQVVKNFDYWSIADVVLTMQYTAKRGSDGFGNDVSTALKNALNEVTAADGKKGIYQLVSMRHELPDLWYHFKAGEGTMRIAQIQPSMRIRRVPTTNRMFASAGMRK